MKERYINLLKSTRREGIEKLIEWLETTDFFTAPASTKYHLSKVNGLLEHSLNVYEEIRKHFEEYDIYTLIIVSLLHDVCKANYYEVRERNVKKNEEWVKEPYYTINEDFPLGHGEKSVILVQKYISLTDEEIAAIRWHMGGFEAKENYSAMSNSFYKYPLALLLHIADLRATYLLEKVEDK